MGALDDRKLGPQRRRVLSERLRRYFDELKADLEADNEAFFRNAVTQASDRARDARQDRPQRRG